MYALLLLCASKSASSSTCSCVSVLVCARWRCKVVCTMYTWSIELLHYQMLHTAFQEAFRYLIVLSSMQHTQMLAHMRTLNAVHSCCHRLVLRLQLCMRQIIERLPELQQTLNKPSALCVCVEQQADILLHTRWSFEQFFIFYFSYSFKILSV